MYVRQPKIGLGLGLGGSYGSGGITWPDGPTLILDFVGSGSSLDLVFAEDITDYSSGTLALDFLSQNYTSMSHSDSYTSFEPDPVMGGFADIQVWSR